PAPACHGRVTFARCCPSSHAETRGTTLAMRQTTESVMLLKHSNWSLVVLTTALSLSCGGPQPAPPTALRPDATKARSAGVAPGDDAAKCAASTAADGKHRRMVHNNEHQNGLTPEALGCADQLLTALSVRPLSTATLQGLGATAREELATKCPYA